jgi:hypothetical protein
MEDQTHNDRKSEATETRSERIKGSEEDKPPIVEKRGNPGKGIITNLMADEIKQIITWTDSLPGEDKARVPFSRAGSNCIITGNRKSGQGRKSK